MSCTRQLPSVSDDTIASLSEGRKIKTKVRPVGAPDQPAPVGAGGMKIRWIFKDGYFDQEKIKWSYARDD
ncbi:hypothetical protein O4H61_06485 [Roseovarius aestuarii]|nr:hypothetical protein [Roseovarius aestuarii]